jgi:hypothetical protein
MKTLGREDNIEKAMELLRKATGPDVTLIQCGAWGFGASRSADGANIFSAKLTNPNHSTEEEDWLALGYAAKLAMVPDTVPMPKTVETSPGSTHYWIWLDGR